MRCAAICLPLEIRSEQLSSAKKRFTAGILWASSQRIYSMWFTETKQYIYNYIKQINIYVHVYLGTT